MSLSAGEWVGVFALALVGIGALAWWLLIATEGVYLGRRVVIGLYDLYARRYDSIKKYDSLWEATGLGRPLIQRLIEFREPLVLDVATGTGRLPLALFAQPVFRGRVVGLDFSRRMLAVASEKLSWRERGRAALIHQPAERLPFPDGTFDAVTCLEALEFVPDSEAVLAELARVLRPGGFLLITNRKGTRLMPGRIRPSARVVETLSQQLGFVEVRSEIWQVDYEQIWAVKPGTSHTAEQPRTVEAVLRCPACGHIGMRREPRSLRCESCQTAIRVADDGVIEYFDAQQSSKRAPLLVRLSGR